MAGWNGRSLNRTLSHLPTLHGLCLRPEGYQSSLPTGSFDWPGVPWAPPVTWPVLKDEEIKTIFLSPGQPRLGLVLPGDDWQLLLCWCWAAPLPSDVCANNFQSEREESCWVRLYRYFSRSSLHTAISPSSQPDCRTVWYDNCVPYYDVLITQQADEDWSIAWSHHSHSSRSNVNTWNKPYNPSSSPEWFNFQEEIIFSVPRKKVWVAQHHTSPPGIRDIERIKILLLKQRCDLWCCRYEIMRAWEC